MSRQHAIILRQISEQNLDPRKAYVANASGKLVPKKKAVIIDESNTDPVHANPSESIASAVEDVHSQSDDCQCVTCRNKIESNQIVVAAETIEEEKPKKKAPPPRKKKSTTAE